MTTHFVDPEIYEPVDTQESPEGLSRRDFVHLLGAGLLITVTGEIAVGQRRGRSGRSFGGRGATNIAARLHIDRDGTITVMTGKVEAGQGSRAEITQAAAEELRLSVSRVRLIMADTALVPDDGLTAGSRTTPSTVPAVRSGAAAARELLVDLAAERWKVDRKTLQVRDGAVVHEATHRTLGYAELARGDDAAKTFARPIGATVSVTAVNEWKVLGTSVPRPNGRDIVMGTHHYASDIVRPGMLHGKILRPPAFGATLTSIDLAPAQAMPGVVAFRDGSFAGCVSPTLFEAEQAVAALAKTAAWHTTPQTSSKELFSHLRKRAEGGGGGMEADLARARKTLHATYEVAYIQHAPMEPRAAVAEWDGDKLTVWTGSQNPFGVRGELAGALNIPADHIRVIVPDTGGGFGGKHTGEAAVEAARLARAAKRPVALRWSREEEFTWAYFRPAALIDIHAGLDAAGTLTVWNFININSGPSCIESPYEIPKKQSRFVRSDPPLRQGSYRALAATANNFARESFMDELAHAAGADPLAFRLAHLKNDRLRAVLEKAAKEFGWNARRGKKPAANTGVGLACGTEKGSYVAACAEIEINHSEGTIRVRTVCEAFECGAILNPDNLRSQVQGCVVMGLGGALSEEVLFKNGVIINPRFSTYQVPRLNDVPQINVHLVNRPDLPPAGAGETPIIAIAPAVANAVFHATGIRIRRMPIRGKELR